MSIKAIVTRGLGFGTIPDLVRRGFGIGLAAEEEEVVPARRPPIDFVIDHPYWSPSMLAFPKRKQPVAPGSDEGELQEMMQIYAKWKAVA